MIRAAFFDVDGTILSHNTKRVPESTRRAIRELQEQGIRCVVATGRHIGELEKLPVADIPFDGYITLNGQIVLDREKNMLFGMPVSGKVKEFLIRTFQEHTFPSLVVEKDRIYLNFVNAHVEALQEAISTPVPPVDAYSGGEIYQVSAYIPEREEEVLAEIWDDCVITTWIAGGVDIIARGGGKVTGIRRYLEGNGISPEETIAFGDGENDMEMLRFAGIGVAMGNAKEKVKQCADYVTADIDVDGLALALEHLGLME